MIAKVIPAVLVSFVLAHPKPEQSTSYQSVRLGAISFPDSQIENVQHEVTSRVENHITLKCQDITPEEGAAGPENHASCERHCESLNKNYTGGKCVGAICHCQLIIRDVELLKAVEKSGNLRNYPTVRCESLIPVGTRKESEKHTACATHCRLLNKQYGYGQCIEGMCHCGKELYPEAREERPLKMKCDEIEDCQAHCESFGRGYTGKCTGETCHCTLTGDHIERERVKCESPITEIDAGNRDACSDHCKSLGYGYEESRCSDGYCFCERGIETRNGFPVEAVKCEELVSDEELDHHEACLNHCQKEHDRRSRCMEGFCQCQPESIKNNTLLKEYVAEEIV